MKTLTREGIKRMTDGSTNVVGGSGTGGGGGGGSAGYAAEAGHAQTADHATEAEKLANNSTDWQKILRKDIADTAAEVITFAKGIVSTLVSKFKAGIKIGASDQYEIDANGDATLHNVVANNIDADGDVDVDGDAVVAGDMFLSGHMSGTTAAFTDVTANNIGNQNNRVAQIYATGINAINTATENLTVTKEAHFTKLVVDELLSNKGALITSCANCVAEVVVDNGTYFDIYFSAVDRDGNAVSNPWLATDQALCLTFNGMGAGTFTDVKNRYYWRVVTRVDSNVTYNGKIYHHIRLSNTSGMYDGSTIPAAGDNLVQLGYRGTVSGNEYRQSATILSSYPTMDAEVTPPSLAFYKGINDFSLSSHRYTFIDGLSNEFIGNFKILVNGSYTNLTTVLATIEGLVTTVTKTVRGKNLIPSEGWSYDDGDLLPVERFDPGDQFLDNGNEDVLYSPVVYLPAGTYVFSLYSSTSSLELYIYSSAQNKPAAASMLVAQNLFISNVLSGDTYQSLPRRYVSFTLQDDAYVVLNVYEDSTQFTAYHPQLEPGSTPTAWEIGTVVKSSQVKQTADMYNINIRTALGQCGVNINGSTREINLIAGKVNFKNSAGSADSGKIQIDAANGRLITHDAILRGNLFLPYTRITQSNWSDYGTYNSNVGTTYNLLGEVTGKTATGLNLQIEYIKTVSGTTNLAHVRLPDLTGKDPESWVGCEVNILNATTTEPLYVRGTLNGDNFGLAKWSNDGWNISDHNVGINPGCEGKFKLIKTGSGIYKWICCYINLNQ